ncbi:MAG: hypothetical protein ACP5G1_03475, partial [Nanopusillaceae archaeon]
MKLMRDRGILILGELPIMFQGGGPIRNENILKYFTKKINFEFIPSIYNIREALKSKNYKEKLLYKIEELNLNVPNKILNFLQYKRYISTIDLILSIYKILKDYKYSLIYSQADVPEDLLLLSKLNGKNKGFLIQGIWFFRNFLEDIKIDYYTIKDIGFIEKSIQRIIYRNLYVHYIAKNINFINTINPAVPEFYL